MTTPESRPAAGTGPAAFEWSPRQLAAIRTCGRDLLVTAGAGTGKTSVLVERILYKLRGGLASLDDLLVVTFTDKAAQQMKDRLAAELARDPKLRRHLPQLPRAAISTIHSFCARLLREHYLEAGIEPGFHILDENAQHEAIQEAMRRTFHEWYSREEGDEKRMFEGLVELAGFDEAGEVLRDVVRRLHDFARTTADPEGYLERLASRPAARLLRDLPWYDAMLEQAGRSWARGLRLYDTALSLAEREGKNTAPQRELYNVLRSFTPERMASPADRARFVEELRSRGMVEGTDGFSIAFPLAPAGSGSIPCFRLFHEEARRRLQRPILRSLPWLPERFLREDEEQRRRLKILVEMARRMDELYGLYKRRHGAMDFSDLEIHTVRLLRDHGEALGLSDRFGEVLVDEFQDVNGLQDYILGRLSPETGRFRVGDVKQSIYQFRLADPTIFLALARGRRSLGKPDDGPPPAGDPAPAAALASQDAGLIVYLSRNHRSRPALLRFVNHVFQGLLREEDIGSPYPAQALEAVREEAAGAVPIEFHILEKGKERDPLCTDLEHEARFTARRLARMIREEHPQVPGKAGERAARWRDVVVLLRSQTRAEVFLKAFQAEGIPAFVSQGGSLLEEEAVRDFRSLLQVVDNPRDDVALAAALRSPLFCIKDSELLRIRLARPGARNLLDAAAAAAYEDDPAAEGGTFWPPAPARTAGRGGRPPDPTVPAFWTGPASPDAGTLVAPPLRARLREILDRVRRWREAESRLELVRFLSLLLEETRFTSVLRGRGFGAHESAGLEKLLSMARDFEAERGPSLHGFLSRLADLEAAGGLSGVPFSTEEEDAVAILTVHKAKGLEFPIVVLPQLEWTPPHDRLGDNIRIGREWVGLRQLEFDTWTRRDSSARWVLAEEQEAARRAEEARILYVALTRARERLVLIGLTRRRVREDEALPDQARRERSAIGRSAMDWLLNALPWETADAVSGGDEAAEGAAPAIFHFPAFPMWVETRPLIPSELESTDGTTHEASGASVQRVGSGDARSSSASADETAAAAVIRSRRPLPVAPGEAARAARAIDELLARAARPDPFPPLARLRDLKGKYWVTELKARTDRQRAEDLEVEGTAALNAASPSAAAAIGTLYHAALARLDLTDVGPAGIDRQMAAFASEPWWEGAARDLQLEEGLAACFATPAGRRLEAAARAGGVLHREVAFTMKWPVLDLVRYQPGLKALLEADPRWESDPWQRALREAWVLLQGRMDCLFHDPDGWTILDWKTDRVNESELAARAAVYTPQMQLYGEAARRLWGGPVKGFLAFVRAGRILEAAGEVSFP